MDVQRTDSNKFQITLDHDDLLWLIRLLEQAREHMEQEGLDERAVNAVQAWIDQLSAIASTV